MEIVSPSLSYCWRIASGPKGLLIVTVGLLGLYGWHLSSLFADVKHPNCDALVAAAQPLPDVVVYGTSWCSQCKKTRWFMKDHEIAYCEYDIELSKTGAKRYQALAGKVIPVIEIGQQYVHGYSEKALKLALHEAGLL